MREPFVVAEGLRKTFRSRERAVIALDDVSFSLARGETLGLVGPSGSGKSTLARALMRLVEPDGGSIRIDGEDWLGLSGKALRRRRGAIQMVFQDPLAAFNPRATIGGALDDPLRIHGMADRGERPRRIAELLERVGLPSGFAQRAVHEVSGGQRQRVAIARALATRPALIVLDEAVSALDVSVRGRILELLADLQKSDGIAFVFVSHDLAVVRVIAHRVAVMDAGRIVETGNTPDVIANPQSATGRALVAAVPTLNLG
ncbi:ATP-binding cassette domain-containing protein [Nitratireductor pacificus]|uniref:Putative ATP-binding component of ABC transporter n=1 Tax=Nitratireductor pacificus pht-3B TaxID=391937 RepID=K2M7T0_9HYPH|nr:ATP-binding cassette domain-containing protein [Nitratireductor pacificus]EKF18266.1 putative ATP-binding component of ABC transporter [Nitratireductor pacificus pht-3B]